MNKLVSMLAVLLFAPLVALAAGDGVKLDRAPINEHDVISLQRGARHFVNYCLNCHGAGYMRYNRLKDIGLTEQQILDNLIFTGVKVGDLMKTAMDPKDAKEWFGTAPPDLTVTARSRASHAGSGADWLYTYLRGFYRDPSRPSGWNNVVYTNVAMPHVLWELQGEQVLKTETAAAPGHPVEVQKLELVRQGTLTPPEYDRLVADLVNYLDYMAEPARADRKLIGIYVLAFLAFMWVLAYLLKKEYWKDVH
ncbi:MAG: cytochrome C [Betaproteobacteria bacterium RIFCSPLOWO2_02_64_14]|nr:MAG: cytochrome C [Betaproteobacteria bacterium RIFCSPLOWO2_02_64_14]